MINRSNWKLVKAYLRYRVEVDQVSAGSAQLEEKWLYHLLEWVGGRSFKDVLGIRPTFPVYVLSVRRDGRRGPLSPVYVRKVVGAGRRFMVWLASHRSGYAGVVREWLGMLSMPRMGTEPTEREVVTLEEVRAMVAAPVTTARDRRIRAAAVFWFLSGIRVGAFVTLPVAAVDVERRTVKQWPSLGVRCKFGQYATTYLLHIPDLLAVVREWDEEVRAAVGDSGLWFAHLSPETGEVERDLLPVGDHRTDRARKDLRDWLERVGLPYHSPHKFRHGHAVFVLKRCRDVADLKALSQNLMHSSLKVTDSVYGVLTGVDVGERIARLSNGNGSGEVAGREALVVQLEALLDQLRADG